jgi:hypothetical protein
LSQPVEKVELRPSTDGKIAALKYALEYGRIVPGGYFIEADVIELVTENILEKGKLGTFVLVNREKAIERLEKLRMGYEKK